MELIKNSHKVKGSFVWYKDTIYQITKSDTDIEGYLILDHQIKVRRGQVNLVRAGDELYLKKSLLHVVPDRCTFGKRRVTHIRSNGMIGTDKDANEFDDTNYKHFEKWSRTALTTRTS
jgi:hypothetical protein